MVIFIDFKSAAFELTDIQYMYISHVLKEPTGTVSVFRTLVIDR